MYGFYTSAYDRKFIMHVTRPGSKLKRELLIGHSDGRYHIFTKPMMRLRDQRLLRLPGEVHSSLREFSISRTVCSANVGELCGNTSVASLMVYIYKAPCHRGKCQTGMVDQSLK